MKKMLILLLVLCMLPAKGLVEAPSAEDPAKAAENIAEFTIAGMPSEDYFNAVSSVSDWISVVSTIPPRALNIDLEQKYNWTDLEEIICAMGRHSIALVEVIGESAEGRRIYSVRVGEGSRYILLTGGVHARETAGTMYIMKQLCTLLNDYAKRDERVMYLLHEFTIIAVPCVNPDGRVILDENENLDWYANAMGVDLDMNFPCSNAGQLALDKVQTSHSEEPASINYPGKSLGSEAETRALISWLEEYINQAVVFIDYAQYGRSFYPSGTYLSRTSSETGNALAQDLAEYISSEGAQYTCALRNDELRGWSGGSILDFAAELGDGLSFSEFYGRLGLDMGHGPMPLCFYEDIDLQAESYVPRSVPLACLRMEISTKGGLGYYDNARHNQAKEYENCGYDGMLYHIMEYELSVHSDHG